MIDEEYVKSLEVENEILRNKNSNNSEHIERITSEILAEKSRVPSASEFLINMIRHKHLFNTKNSKYISCGSEIEYFNQYGLVCNLGRRGGNTTTAINIIQNSSDMAYVCSSQHTLDLAKRLLNTNLSKYQINTYNPYDNNSQNVYKYNGNILTTLGNFENLCRGVKYYCVIFDGINFNCQHYKQIIEKLALNKTVLLHIGDCYGF